MPELATQQRISTPFHFINATSEAKSRVEYYGVFRFGLCFLVKGDDGEALGGNDIWRMQEREDDDLVRSDNEAHYRKSMIDMGSWYKGGSNILVKGRSKEIKSPNNMPKLEKAEDDGIKPKKEHISCKEEASVSYIFCSSIQRD